MRASLAGALVALWLGACAVPRPPAGPTAFFDLGAQPDAPRAGADAATGLDLRSVEVFSPSWLDRSSLQYRLAYLSASRRQHYAESRWVAPPGELVELAVRRAVLPHEGADSTGGCRLRLDLDEFVQSFASPERSSGLIEVRAALLAPRTDLPLARKRFVVETPAPSADASGAVEALARGVREFNAQLRAWIAGLAPGPGGRPELTKICRGA